MTRNINCYLILKLFFFLRNMNNNDDSEDSDSGSEASSRGALLQTREGRGGAKHDNRGKSKRKAKKMVPMV